MEYLHITIAVGFDGEGGSWRSGRGESSVQFDIPKEMFNGSNFLKLVESTIKEAEAKYPEAKKEADERNARYDREREEKRLKEEAEKPKEEQDHGTYVLETKK